MSTKSKRQGFMPRFSFKLPQKLRRISAVSSGSSGPPTPRARGRRAAFSAVHFKKEKIMKQLQTAIEKGDSGQVEDVVDMVDICELEEGSLSFVKKACEHDNLDIIAILLRTGASVNTIGEGKYAPIHIAARKGNAAMAAILLSNSANPNCQTKYDKKTPLHIASLEGHNDMVRLLLANEADVNMGDIYGGSPLHIACRMGRQTIVETLLTYHASIDGYDNEGWTGLHLAAEAGHDHIVKLLLEANANLDSQSKYGRTPLHWACVSGHVAVVHTLIQKGASANIRDRHDKLPLHYAKSETVKTLVNLHTDKGNTNKQFASTVGLYFNPKPESTSRLLPSHSRMSSVSRSVSSDPLLKPARSNRSSMTIHEAPDRELPMSSGKIHAHRMATSLSNPVTIIVQSEPDDDTGDGILMSGEVKVNKLSLSTSFQKLVGTTNGQMDDIGNAMTELDTVLKLVLDKSLELTSESVTEYIAKVGVITKNLNEMKESFSSETQNVKTLISDADNKGQGLTATGNPSYIALVQLLVQCLCNYIGKKENGWKSFLNCLPLGGDTSTILAFQLGMKTIPPEDKVKHVIMHWARSCDAEMTGSYMKTLLQTLQKCKFSDVCQVGAVLEELISLETEFRSGEAENRSSKIAMLVHNLHHKDVRHMYNVIDSSHTDLNVFPTLDELSVSESDSECPSKPNNSSTNKITTSSSVKSQKEKLEDLLRTIVEDEDQGKMVEAIKYLVMFGHEELITYLL